MPDEKKNQINDNQVELSSIICFKIKKIPGRRIHREPIWKQQSSWEAGVGSIDVGSHSVKDEHT